MKCIYCTHKNTEVVNTRQTPSNKVWRRRKCPTCKEIFTTQEEASLHSFFVIKRNFSKQRFVYEKLFVSLLLSILDGKESDRGDVALYTKKIIDEIMKKYIQENKSKNFTSKEIIIRVFMRLSKENKMWGLRYGLYSVYRKKVLESKHLL